MVRELESRGYTVIGFDINGPGNYDVLDLFRGNHSEFSRTSLDLVVHCAYHVGGRAAIDGVNTNFAKNLQLDAALFEWAVRTKQKRVLYFSSSAAYPVWMQSKTGYPEYDEIEFIPLKEDYVDLRRPAQPDANYGWAKLTGERLAEDARKNGLSVTVVRPFSGYGEDQSRDYPFPSIVARAKAGDLSVWGPPGQTRDWIHVSDVVQGALAVVEQQSAWVDIDDKPLSASATEPVNLCTGRGVEMGELMRMAYAAYPGMRTNTMPSVTYDESKPTGVFYRVGDPARMLQYYEPKVSLEEGIARALKASK
jgi:nucleoside-diphosphate-sugar epimerase